MSRSGPARQRDELRRLMQQLFRRFGVLATNRTPCGKPLAIAHAHALMVLLARGELAQQDLGAELGIDKSNVTRLCAHMVEAGHVHQRQSETDGRSRRVSLTARGQRLARDVETASGARFGALLSELPAASRTQVLLALQHLVTALDALDALPGPRDGRTSE